MAVCVIYKITFNIVIFENVDIMYFESEFLKKVIQFGLMILY